MQTDAMHSMDAIVSLVSLLLITGVGGSRHGNLAAAVAVTPSRTMAPMEYWQAVLPGTSMPQAIHDLLTQSTVHASWDDKNMVEEDNANADMNNDHSQGPKGEKDSRKITTSYGSEGKANPKKITMAYGSRSEEDPRKTTISYVFHSEEDPKKATVSYSFQGEEDPRKITLSYGSQGKKDLMKITRLYGSQDENDSRRVTTSYGSQGEDSRIVTTSYGFQGEKDSKKTTVSYGFNSEEDPRKATVSYGSQGEDSRKITVSYKYQGDRHDHVHSHNNGNEVADVFFFHDVLLRPGSVITPTIPPTTTVPPLLPRREADSLPFSAERFSDILAMFAPASHAMADEVRWALDTCEHPRPLSGQKAGCATSLESLAKLPAALLETRNVRAFSGDMPTDPAGTPARRGRHNVTAVRKLSESPEAVTCHDLTYPYAVFYCHTTNPAATYVVTLAAEDGGAPAMEALAVCHLDTSRWNPKNPFFAVHNLKPGEVAVCHFLSKLSTVWVPAGEQGGAREAR